MVHSIAKIYSERRIRQLWFIDIENSLPISYTHLFGKISYIIGFILSRLFNFSIPNSSTSCNINTEYRKMIVYSR